MSSKQPITIYHNPRCSKSRQTLALLNEKGIEPTVIEYLRDPPDAPTLTALIRMLGIRAIDLVRKKEDPYTKLGLAEKQDDDASLIKAMVEHPILIERPIVVKGKKAALGRPPEKVLKIL